MPIETNGITNWFKQIDKRDKRDFIIRLVLFAALAVLFVLHPSWYVKVDAGGIHLAKKRLILYFMAGMFFLLLPLFKLKKWEGKKRFLWVPVILGGILFCLAMGENTMKFQFWKMDPFLILHNIILLFGFFMLFFAICCRVKISLVLTYILVAGFAMLNYFIYKFRGEPINAADIYVAGTALNVAADYSFTLTRQMFTGLFGGVCLISTMMWLPAEDMALKGKKRLAAALPALALALSITYIYALSDVPSKMQIKVKVFNPYKSYQKNGEALNFIRSFYYMQLDKPVGYSAKNAEKMMADSGYESDDISDHDTSKDPNIIILMNESLTDFTTYDVVETSDDPFAFIHSLSDSKQAITGKVHVDVFGGRTANTEYEYLTGNSVAFMPSYAVPYALYVRKPQPSLTWNMIDIGYSGNDAFHPYKANGYSRPRAYPNLGFREFISLETIKEECTEDDYVRNKISDAGDYRWVIKKYEEERKTTDAPFYMFNVTIQNHGGFVEDYDNFIQDIDISGLYASDDAFKRFINLCDYSDEAFEELTKYFSNVDEPTILVLFGDHKPNLHNGFFNKLYGKNPSKLSPAKMFQHYETPLVIWANYEIDPDGEYDREYENISINYLSAAITEIAGLPQTAYQKFLNDMRKQIPVFTAHRYRDTEGNIYKLDDMDSPYFDLVNEYHTYEYNYQFDAKHRNEDFFCLRTTDSALNRARETQ